MNPAYKNLLALINPISKICILSVFSNDSESQKEFNQIVKKSTAIALLILAMVMLFRENSVDFRVLFKGIQTIKFLIIEFCFQPVFL